MQARDNRRRFKPYAPLSNKRPKYNAPSSLEWSKLPFFILPDVLLNDGPTVDLAEQVYETFQNNGKGPANIFTYNTQVLEIEKLASMDQATHVDQLLSDILFEQKNSFLPIILAGYSSGSSLAGELAFKLNELGYKVIIFTLDGPARSMLRSFADSTENISFSNFKNELVAVAAYAARLSGITSKLGLDAETIKRLTPNEILRRLDLNEDEFDISGFMRTERITLFFNNMIEQVTRSSNQDNNAVDTHLRTKFVSYLMLGKRMLLNELGVEPKGRPKFTKVHTVVTEESAQKFGATDVDSFSGDWENYAEQVVQLNSGEHALSRVKHSELLNKENAALIAELIYNVLNKDPELTPKQLASLQSKGIHGQAYSNPNIKEDEMLEQDLQDLARIVGPDKLQAAFSRLFTPKPFSPRNSAKDASLEDSPLGSSPDESTFEQEIILSASTTPTLQAK